MRITGRQLRRIIQEEVARMINEEDAPVSTGLPPEAPVAVRNPLEITKEEATAAFEEAIVDGSLVSELRGGLIPGHKLLSTLNYELVPLKINSGRVSFEVNVMKGETGSSDLARSLPRVSIVKVLGLDVEGKSMPNVVKLINEQSKYVRREKTGNMKLLLEFSSIERMVGGTSEARKITPTKIKFF